MKAPKPVLFLYLICLLQYGCQRDPHVDLGNGTPSSPDTPPAAKDLGMLYAANTQISNGITCVNLNKDSIEWQKRAFLSDNNGFVYDSGVIYTGNLYGATALDAKTGITLWSTNTSTLAHGQSGYTPSNQPILHDSLLYLITYAEHNYESPSLCCIRKSSGALVWRQDLVVGLSPNWFYTTPVVVGDKLIALSSAGSNETNRVHCFNRFTGTELWRVLTGPGSWRGNPTLLDDHHVLFTTNQNHVFKVSVDDGTVVHFWSVPPTEKLKPYLNILKKDGQLFIGADFGIHIVDAVTGQTLRELKDTIFTYAVTSNTIYLRKLLGVVQAKDLATFTTKWTWRSPLKHYVDSSNYYGVIDPKTSCLVSDDQYVYYYEMTPTGTSQIFNSIYILNAQTGALVKEIKLPTSYPVPVLGINQMVVRGNKAYRPVSNFIRFDW